MRSRERVLLALEHKEPDRVPIDLGGTRATTIMALAYADLKRYLGLTSGEIRVYDINCQLAEPEKEILELFSVDVIDIGRSLPPAYPEQDICWIDWKLPDGTPCKVLSEFYQSIVPVTVIPCPPGKGKIKLEKSNDNGWILKWGEIVWAKMYKGNTYFTDVYHPLEKAESKKEIDEFFEGAYNEKLRYPYILGKEDYESLRKRAKYLYEHTDYALVGSFGGNFIESGEFLMGYPKFLLYVVKRKDLIEHLFEKLLDLYMKNIKTWLDAVKDYIQVIVFSDDAGTQTGPQMPPKTFRELWVPFAKELYGYVKRSSNLYILLHCCGSIYHLLEDIIDAGVDAINPVQISARFMEPEKLKKEFGEELTFWGGGIDTQRVLPFADPDKVKEEVKKNISIFAPNGGFVFATVHNITAGVPPENVIAVFEAAKKYGVYPR